MAATLHLALGMLLGCGLAVPRLWNEWRAGVPLAPAFLRWIVMSLKFSCTTIMRLRQQC